MKGHAVNPNRLKKGVIYKFTRRIDGDEFWEFVKYVEPNSYGDDDIYQFKQVSGKFYSNGTVDYFDSIDLGFYMYYTNKAERTLLKKLTKNYKKA